MSKKSPEQFSEGDNENLEVASQPEVAPEITLEKRQEVKAESQEEREAEIEKLKHEIEKVDEEADRPQEAIAKDPRITEKIKGLTDPPKEFGFKERLMNVVSEPWFVDNALQKRAEWFVEKSQIERHLKPNGRYLDVGTGKGHIVERILRDMEESGNPLETYYGIDNADKPLKKVQKREAKRRGVSMRENPNPMNFSFNSADELPFKDGSLDGVSYVFSIHHMNREMTGKVMQEAMRVIKPDGYVFIAEDIVNSEEQRQRTAKRDDQLNWDWGEGEHNYKSDQEWKEYFDSIGLETVANEFFESETKKGPIPHGFYVLRKKQEGDKKG